MRVSFDLNSLIILVADGPSAGDAEKKHFVSAFVDNVEFKNLTPGQELKSQI